MPSNMVSEIQLDDAEIEAHLFASPANRMTSKALRILLSVRHLSAE